MAAINAVIAVDGLYRLVDGLGERRLANGFAAAEADASSVYHGSA